MKAMHCTRTSKRCYRSQFEAVIGAAKIRPGYGRLRPYKCGYCGWWHLTHQQKRGAL